MPNGRNLTPEQLRYAHRWELLRSDYYSRLGPHYAELASECGYAADIYESRLQTLEQETA